MDSLFAGPASERRRFLDRLVLALDPNHGARVSQFERALRGRNRLLEEGARNAPWLDAIEREAAELGVAVAAARVECVTRLKALIALDRDEASPFPWADLSLEGEVEALAAEHPALAAEDKYRAALRDNRSRDAAAGRTLIGPHVGDLLVFHGPKGAPAAQSSTGEQRRCWSVSCSLTRGWWRICRAWRRSRCSTKSPHTSIRAGAPRCSMRWSASAPRCSSPAPTPPSSPGSANGRGCSKSFPGALRPGRAAQAWPASEDSQAALTPSSASARSYFASKLGSKISFESAGETSQPLARISLSNWPDAQPA